VEELEPYKYVDETLEEYNEKLVDTTTTPTFSDDYLDMGKVEFEDFLEKTAFQTLNISNEEGFLQEMDEKQMGILAEDFLGEYEEEPDIQHLDQRYFNDDFINLGGFDVVLDDIFVKPPQKKRKQQQNLKEGSGYMLKRLFTLEPYIMIQQQYKYTINNVPQYLTMGSFIEQLKYFCFLYDKTTIDSDRVKIVLGLYKLFTNTFITESTNEYNKKHTYIHNRNVLFGIEMKLTNKQYEQAYKMKKILQKKTKTGNYVLNTTYAIYETQRQKDIKLDIETKQKIYLNPEIDKYLYDLLMADTIVVEENLFEKIMSE